MDDHGNIKGDSRELLEKHHRLFYGRDRDGKITSTLHSVGGDQIHVVS